MKTPRAILILLLLLTGVFTLATSLQPRALTWSGRSQSDSALRMFFGESRRLFANHFFIKADVYFHSGYYPSIFDQAREGEEKEKELAGGHDEHEKEVNFFGEPTDWIDRFGRHFRIMDHTHLEGGNTREILPWLQISAGLDPHRIDTYTVAAYWLRTSLGKIDGAEQFLRQGLEANPNSYEILFDLGSLYYENRHDATRARNLWQLALRRWNERESTQKEPNIPALDAITMNLARLEENEGNFAKAIEWLEKAKAHSPAPEAVQKQIDALRTRLATQPAK